MLQARPATRPRPLVRLPLHTGWTVRPLDGSGEHLSATVPGCVHTDLLDAGRIPDPFHALNELEVGWVGRTGWRYETVFRLDSGIQPDERVELVCDGLDTSATVRLNGVEVATVCNMHVRHRFDIAPLVREGENTLVIDFEAPMDLIERLAREHGELPHEGAGSNPPHPHNAARKMACAFGWDWGPVLPSVGIWRPIAIERWSQARLGDTRPLVTHADTHSAVIEVRPQIAFATDEAVAVVCELAAPDGRVVAEARTEARRGHTAVLTLRVDTPQLWWPSGHGEQPLYALRTRLIGDGQELDARAERVGLRRVELIEEPDPARTPLGQGRTLHFRVNGRRIFCKGANWIPDDPFPSRITPARYRERVMQAKRANMNMLRVWGGGIYEDHAFYEACDELGIMVWQDFLCACSAYHEHEPYRSWFEAEARDNVSRLAGHASLVLWCGNNECLEAVPHWGPFKALRDDPSIPWGLHYYYDMFPAIVAEIDPTRPFIPGSPFTPGEVDKPRIEHSGDVHIWDVWNGAGDAKRYLMHAPRFASEFGFHGPPTWPTLKRAIPADQRRYDSPAMVHHNKHAGGQPLANTRMADYFEPPAGFDDWLYLAQVVQARSLALGCEWFRALSPWCSGALYWQFNDLWPVSSWAAVDGEGRPKPLWFATRRFFRPRLLTIRPAAPMTDTNLPGPMAAYLHNDHAETWSTRVLVERRDLSGGAIETLLDRSVSIEPGDCLRLPLEEDAPDSGDRGDRFLVATAGPDRAFWFPRPDREILYPVPKLDFQLERDGERHELHIKAHSLVRDLCFFPDRIHDDATVSDQLMTLLPGDEATIWIRSPRPLELRELVQPPVMQTVNRFGKILGSE